VDLTRLERLGLYDPAAPDADERRRLLEVLIARGVTEEEMLAAEAEHRLPFVLGDRLVSPGPAEHTLADVAHRLDLPIAEVDAYWRALGLPAVEPNERRFAEADVRTLQLIAAAAGAIGPDGALQLARAIGAAMARVAETGFTIGLARVEGGFLARADSWVAAAEASELLGLMSQVAPVIFDSVLRRQIEVVVRRWDANPPDDPETTTLAVGFADLIGFTNLINRLGAAELAITIDDLEALASDTVAAANGRLVKLIGDEVMFVAPSADAGCEIALALVDTIAEHPSLPPLRVGLAYGTVVPVGGDYFGQVVNLASRLCDVARAGEVLAGAAMTRELDVARYIAPSRHRMSLKGFDEPMDAAVVQRAR
jgi:class 3 adenylate cyclase